MALTPEDVLNQKFTITKFRDGYDLDQVDEFLDTIVEELREREQTAADLQEQLNAAQAEVDALKRQLAEAQQDGTPVSERTIVVDAPPAAPAPSAPAADSEADAAKSSAMLKLALELHDKYIQEGEMQRDQLIEEAETKARTLLGQAEEERERVLKDLEAKRGDMKEIIKELREFEGEYRTTLRSYIQSQLRNLDGSPEPEGAPAGLD